MDIADARDTVEEGVFGNDVCALGKCGVDAVEARPCTGESRDGAVEAAERSRDDPIASARRTSYAGFLRSKLGERAARVSKALAIAKLGLLAGDRDFITDAGSGSSFVLTRSAGGPCGLF